MAFARVTVDHVAAGNTRVAWEIARHFLDPGPYVFQLQAGKSALADANDWVDVGSIVTDTYQAFDVMPRLFGKTLDTHYRVRLTTPLAAYISPAVRADGLLSKRDWLLAREVIRKEQLRHRVLTSPRGFLLKVRRYGPRCSECTDIYTDEVSKSQCPTCFGTGFELGYFEPLAAFYGDVTLEQARDHRDPQVGMQQQNVIQARFVGDTQVFSYDAWVNEFSDKRYYIHKVDTVAQVRDVPVVVQAELRLAPFSDIIYTLEIDKDEIPSPPGLTAEKGDKVWREKRKQRPNTHATTYLEDLVARSRQQKRR